MTFWVSTSILVLTVHLATGFSPLQPSKISLRGAQSLSSSSEAKKFALIGAKMCQSEPSMQNALKNMGGPQQVETFHDLWDEESVKSQNELWKCAETGDVEGIRAAMSEGADVNLHQQDEALARSGLGSWKQGLLGPSALHLAAMFGKSDACGELLKLGADVNSKTSEGTTPLHMALISDNSEIINLFVNAGADIDAKNEFDESPRDMAANMGITLPDTQ